MLFRNRMKQSLNIIERKNIFEIINEDQEKHMLSGILFLDGRRKEDLIRRFRTSQEVFATQEEDDREYLQLFAFICALGFDVYMKKQTMELLIDQIREEYPADGKKKK